MQERDEGRMPKLSGSAGTNGRRCDPDYQDGETARDEHIFRVADHGVDPTPMPKQSATAGMAQAHHRAGWSGRSGGDGRFTARDFLLWCGIPVLIVLLIRVLIVGFYEIPSRSMENTIMPGDRVITSKLTPRYFDLERGDIVVFKDPANWLSDEQTNAPLGGYLIKRLIGLPGDTVACAGAGQPVTVNGVAIDESDYLREGVDPSAFPFSVTVSEGHVFVMGDNRANSADSRAHQNDGANGLVPIDDVVGVGLCRYWPLNRVGPLESHHEVFDAVPDSESSGDA